MPDPKTPAPPAPQEWTVIKTERQMSLVRFSPCGKFIAASGRDGEIHRWEIITPPPPMEDPIAAADAQNKAKKPPAKPVQPTLPELPVMKGHNGWVTNLMFLSHAPQLVSCDSYGEIVCWPYLDKEPKPAWKISAAHDGWIRQLALSPDGKTLVSCGRDQKVCLWSTTDGKKLGELVGHHEDVHSVAFHPDGKSLVSGDLRGVVKQWDLATNKSTRTFDAGVMFKLDRLQDVGGVRVLRFDAAGKILAIGGARPEGGGFVTGTPVLILVDWATGKAAAPLDVGTKQDVYLLDLVHHRDGYLMGVTSGQPGNGQVFFLRPGESQPFFTKKLANCHSIDIHPSGTRFALIANAGVFGQGEQNNARKNGYPGNYSPIHIFDLPQGT